MEKKRGTVKWFSVARGYGFISDEDGVDYFVHFSQIQTEGFKKLSGGQAVEFSIGKNEAGQSVAVMVTPLS